MAKVIDFQKFKDQKELDEAEITEQESRQASIKRLLGYASKHDWDNDREGDDQP